MVDVLMNQPQKGDWGDKPQEVESAEKDVVRHVEVNKVGFRLGIGS